jgi:hypothetical protein
VPLTSRIALIDKTGAISSGDLLKAAAAIGVQVQRDLSQYWPVNATVSVWPDDGTIPAGVWPVYIVPQIGGGVGGYHQSEHNQPYANVALGPTWTLAASHEVMEMLVDPSGDYLVASSSIEIVNGKVRDGGGKFEYLVEICDPSERPDNAYLIDDVLVSDFYTQHYYDPLFSPATLYSFNGKIKAPRQVLAGGYLSWWNGDLGLMQQLKYVDPNSPPSIVDIGRQPPGTSLREFVDSRTQTMKDLSSAKGRLPVLKKRATREKQLYAAALGRAKLFEEAPAAVKFADIAAMFTDAQAACMAGQNPPVLLKDFAYMSDANADGMYPDHANARHVFARLSGTTEGRRMPPNGPYWAAAQLAQFQDWMTGGFQP